MFIQVIVILKDQYIVNQHFLKLVIPAIDLLYGSLAIVSDYHKMQKEIVKLKSVLRQLDIQHGSRIKLLVKFMTEVSKKDDYHNSSTVKRTVCLVLHYLAR